MSPVSELLTEAKALLEAGWVKGVAFQLRWLSAHKRLETYCITGACGRVVNGPLIEMTSNPRPMSGAWSQEAWDAYDSMMRFLACDAALNFYGTVRSHRVQRYNDSPLRTKREVLELMDRAIARAKEAEDAARSGV